MLTKKHYEFMAAWIANEHLAKRVKFTNSAVYTFAIELIEEFHNPNFSYERFDARIQKLIEEG